MKNNIVWYEINPHYFEQIAYIKGWIDSLGKVSLFQIIENNLHHIQSLGCTGIWLMPLYIRGQKNKKGFGSPYAIKEYQISPEWGTDEQLQSLIKEAKQKNLKIIGEYIPNHLAPDAPFLNKEENLFYRDENNCPLYDQDWTDTVKLNHSHSSIQGFTRANLIWLAKTYGFDGFRLDMAHYPFHGATKNASFGEGELNFWDKVLNHEFFQAEKFYWLAEVYDDRSQACYGYDDYIKLLKQNFIVYDKKTHDILARKLKYGIGLSDRLYEEIYTQYQALHSLGIDTRIEETPFLRMPSNHDDAPGIKNFGGLNEYILATALLTFLPGHLVIYAGDEYGLKVKPSVTGINYCDEHGNMTECNQIRFLPESDQNKIFESFKQILVLRQQEKALNSGSLLIAKIAENQDLFAFVRYCSEEIILIAVNFSKSETKLWGQIKNFFPTFDFPKYEFCWTELLESINPKLKSKSYKVQNLKTQEVSSLRKFNDEFWIGLEPLEIQILKIIP